jgi:hypothetical protein
VAIALGVWAEFADLSAPLLFVVSLPAIVVSTACAAMTLPRVPVVLALLVGGIVFGVVTFGLSAGTHVLLSWVRGSELDFSDYDSRALASLGFVAVHLAAGAIVGAAVGAVLALLYAANRWVVSRNAAD